MQGYDKHGVLLLPPRVPGESLPTELLDYYKEYCSQKLKDEGTVAWGTHTVDVHIYLQSVISYCTCAYCVSVFSLYNVFYLCTPELKGGLCKEETKKDDMQEEEKSSTKSDYHLADSEEEEVRARTLRTTGLCEYCRTIIKNSETQHANCSLTSLIFWQVLFNLLKRLKWVSV